MTKTTTRTTSSTKQAVIPRGKNHDKPLKTTKKRGLNAVKANEKRRDDEMRMRKTEEDDDDSVCSSNHIEERVDDGNVAYFCLRSRFGYGAFMAPWLLHEYGSALVPLSLKEVELIEQNIGKTFAVSIKSYVSKYNLTDRYCIINPHLFYSTEHYNQERTLVANGDNKNHDLVCHVRDPTSLTLMLDTFRYNGKLHGVQWTNQSDTPKIYIHGQSVERCCDSCYQDFVHQIMAKRVIKLTHGNHIMSLDYFEGRTDCGDDECDITSVLKSVQNDVLRRDTISYHVEGVPAKHVVHLCERAAKVFVDDLKEY